MRQRRPVDATLRQPPCLSHGGNPTGGRRALGHGTDVRTGCEHQSSLAGVSLGEPSSPPTAQGG